MRDINYKNNQTVKFILPLLLSEIEAYYVIRKEFLGAFIGDISEPKWDGKLVLAYKYPYTSEWVKFEKQLLNSGFHIADYDYSDEQIAMYVLDIPQNLLESVNNILDGYYSKLEPSHKLIISKFWIGQTGSTIVESIFDDNHSAINTLWKSLGKNKEDHCQINEYWFKPDFEEELFDIDQY